MKAMCLDCIEYRNNFVIRIPFGEIVTIVGESDVYVGAVYIAEYPVDKRGIRSSYVRDNFAPLSDIDETELIRERKTETA